MVSNMRKLFAFTQSAQLHWAKTPSLCALVLSAAGDRLAPPLSSGQVNFLAPFVFCLLMNLISNCARHEDSSMINYRLALVLLNCVYA